MQSPRINSYGCEGGVEFFYFFYSSSIVNFFLFKVQACEDSFQYCVNRGLIGSRSFASVKPTDEVISLVL